jgi:hypothetical protein
MNTELLCDLFLPFARLPVRGLVVWVQHQPVCGMGIMFLDLSDHDRSLIQDAISGFAEQSTPVKVWMETLTQPIQAHAVRTGQAMTLRSQLSFLRLSSPVVVYPNAHAVDPAQSTSGILQNVSLSADPQHKDPVLQLHLKIQDPAQEGPDPEMRICTPVEDTEERSEELAQEPHEEGWEVDLSDLEREEWKMQSEHPTLKIEQRKRRHPWLWLAALAMVGLTVASVLYTDLYQRAWDRFQTWLAAPPDLSSIENQIASLYPTEPPHAPDPSPALVPADSARTDPAQPESEHRVDPVDRSEDPSDPPDPPPPSSVDPPQPALHRQSIEVALRGSTEGATSYKLADPNGIAVNLPKARARGNLGIQKVDQGPFRSIWLRKREGGLQLRVMVRGDLPDYELKLSQDKIKVVLK